jgi:ABC-type dipeptide/oligopeptide/nickel transport system ATPase component
LLTSSRPNVTRGRAGDWTPGQALVLLGEAGVGKSALQILITALLTGRFADRTAYFLGTSNFSGEMALVEHWAMSDPEWDDNKQKQKLAKGYKKGLSAVSCG